jgi:hypothetical protein
MMGPVYCELEKLKAAKDLAELLAGDEEEDQKKAA